jgi:hypothetical protein
VANVTSGGSVIVIVAMSSGGGQRGGADCAGVQDDYSAAAVRICLTSEACLALRSLPMSAVAGAHARAGDSARRRLGAAGQDVVVR